MQRIRREARTIQISPQFSEKLDSPRSESDTLWEAENKERGTMFFIRKPMRNIIHTAAAVLSVALITETYAAGIAVGSNFFETVPGLTATLLDFTREVIARGFFGPGSDAFMGAIRLKGDPIDPTTLGTTDTIMARPEVINVVLDARPVTANLDLLTLELKSVTPITVTYNSGHDPEQWDVRVSRQGGTPEGGRITIKQTTADGGTYEAMVNARLTVTFTRHLDGAIRQLPLALVMGTGAGSNVPWSFSAENFLITDGHFCPSCVAGGPRPVVFSGPNLTLKLQPATRFRGN